MSRVGAAFRRARLEGRAALVVYLMAGDPDLRTTEKLAFACERGGADVVELGIPFSDPIADGPEIQMAGQRALRAGTKPRQILDLVARLRRETEMPLVVMSYLNPILAIGLDSFAERAREAGLDGLIVPDLSLEESGEVRAALDPRGIDHVQLVSPATAVERARAIGKASRGFLYVVARYGTTGVRSDLPEDLSARLFALHRATSLPLAVGFGISGKDHVLRLAASGADGIVVGSAIVHQVAQDPDPKAVERFVAELASGLEFSEVTSPAHRGSSR